MNEDLRDYILTVKNNPEIRDVQMCDTIDNLVTIHDQTFDTGVNNYGLDILTLLLSYVERLSYIDKNRMKYDTYERFAEFLQMKPQKEKDYLANAEVEIKEKHPAAESIETVMINICNSVQDPTFRVHLILLTIGIFKDEGAITKKQRTFLDKLFEDIQVK